MVSRPPVGITCLVRLHPPEQVEVLGCCIPPPARSTRLPGGRADAQPPGRSAGASGIGGTRLFRTKLTCPSMPTGLGPERSGPASHREPQHIRANECGSGSPGRGCGQRDFGRPAGPFAGARWGQAHPPAGQQQPPTSPCVPDLPGRIFPCFSPMGAGASSAGINRSSAAGTTELEGNNECPEGLRHTAATRASRTFRGGPPSV